MANIALNSAGPKNCATRHQRQKQRGKGEDHVHDPHDDGVDPFRREEPGDQSDDDAAGQRPPQTTTMPDEEGEPRAVQIRRERMSRPTASVPSG